VLRDRRSPYQFRTDSTDLTYPRRAVRQFRPKTVSAATSSASVEARTLTLAIRLLGEAERMAAVVTHILGVARPAREKSDAMRPEEAGQRMANSSLAGSRLQKAVTAVARVLDAPITLCHDGHTMAEQAARVSHFFGERLAARKSVRGGRKQQRMAASDADVLVHPIAIRETDVRVMPEKAGERMAHVRRAAVLREVVVAAAATPDAPRGLPEHFVVDDVAPDGTTQPHPERDRSEFLHIREMRNRTPRRLTSPEKRQDCCNDFPFL
jgi:hypothetical protein